MLKGSHLPLDAASERSLRKHYLFAALTEPQWERIRTQVRALRLPAGGRLFERDDPADAFFVVLTGGMKLYRESAAGFEKIMRLVRSGQSFAESVLFSDPPRYPVHAEAVSSSVLAAVPREPFLALLRESFDTCRAVMAAMVERIHHHWDEIEALTLHSSQGRVARYLLELTPSLASRAREVRLPARKTLIAGQLGLAPETLSRGLRALADRGVIAVHGQTVEILDQKALEERAGE